MSAVFPEGHENLFFCVTQICDIIGKKNPLQIGEINRLLITLVQSFAARKLNGPKVSTLPTESMQRAHHMCPPDTNNFGGPNMPVSVSHQNLQSQVCDKNKYTTQKSRKVISSYGCM